MLKIPRKTNFYSRTITYLNAKDIRTICLKKPHIKYSLVLLHKSQKITFGLQTHYNAFRFLRLIWK